MAIWFETGNVMADGETKRTVCAKSDIEADECRQKGWKELGGDDKPMTDNVGTPVKGVTGAGNQERGPAHRVLAGAIKGNKKKKGK